MFGNSKKTKKHNTVAMSATNVVMDVAYGQVYWPVLILASTNGNSSFITWDDDRYEQGSVCARVDNNCVL